MQNKPNFQKAKTNLNFYSAKDYENKLTPGTPKNKPTQTQSCRDEAFWRRRVQKASPFRILEKSSGLTKAYSPAGLYLVSIFKAGSENLLS